MSDPGPDDPLVYAMYVKHKGNANNLENTDPSEIEITNTIRKQQIKN